MSNVLQYEIVVKIDDKITENQRASRLALYQHRPLAQTAITRGHLVWLSKSLAQVVSHGLALMCVGLSRGRMEHEQRRLMLIDNSEARADSCETCRRAKGWRGVLPVLPERSNIGDGGGMKCRCAAAFAKLTNAVDHWRQ